MRAPFGFVARASLVASLVATGGAETARAQQPSVPERPALPAGADPNSWEAYFDLGVQAFRRDAEISSAAFYWASRVDPSRAEPYFARWAVILQRTKHETVGAYLRRDEKVTIQPAFVEADSVRELALARNPFVHRGLEVIYFDGLPGRFSDDRDTRAWIAYGSGDFPRAIQLLTTSIDRKGKAGLWLRYDRATAAVMAGNLPLALSDLTTLVGELRAADEKEAVTFYRSKHLLLYMIGMIQRQLRNVPAARSALGEALVENAGFAYASAELGAIARSQRQNAAAAEHFATAVGLAPGDGVLKFQYAEALFDLRQPVAASAQLREAIALEPYYAAPRHLLGRILESQADTAAAFKCYDAFVSLAPATNIQARALRVRLDARPSARPPAPR